MKGKKSFFIKDLLSTSKPVDGQKVDTTSDSVADDSLLAEDERRYQLPMLPLCMPRIHGEASRVGHIATGDHVGLSVRSTSHPSSVCPPRSADLQTPYLPSISSFFTVIQTEAAAGHARSTSSNPSYVFSKNRDGITGLVPVIKRTNNNKL